MRIINILLVALTGFALLVLVGSWGTPVSAETATAPGMCPKMKDFPCTAKGTYASTDPALALSTAKKKCDKQLDACKTKQDQEDTNNRTKCLSVQSCEFDHRIDSSYCLGNLKDNCTESNGLTTCTIEAKYNWTSYTCKKPVSAVTE